MSKRVRPRGYATDLTDAQWAALAPVVQRPRGAGPAHHSGPPGGLQCAAVPGAGRVSLAVAAARVSAVDRGAVLLRQMDPRWHVGRGEPPVGGAGARAAGPHRAADGRAD